MGLASEAAGREYSEQIDAVNDARHAAGQPVFSVRVDQETADAIRLLVRAQETSVNAFLANLIRREIQHNPDLHLARVVLAELAREAPQRLQEALKRAQEETQRLP